MAQGKDDKGYWGGYPSYLLDPDKQGGFPPEASADDPFANYEGEGASRSTEGSYWGSLGPDPFGFTSPNHAPGSFDGPRTPACQGAGIQEKSHVIAGILALLLGCFGIHKFYLGYNSTGILMLGVTVIGSIFTFGLAGMMMGLISLIEGVIYLATSQTAFTRAYVHDRRPWF